ncbi:hypothetical protein [Nocardia alni]|uniref:hypothetical protein n=1 Tax=Nocardia alni TaxID=2815723 RepID=UPI001C238116|nr:hypothetical protein [Nocardia alni]
MQVNNGSDGLITALEVDVFAVDSGGNRTGRPCVPAKGKVDFSDIIEEVMRQHMRAGDQVLTSEMQSRQAMMAALLGSRGRVYRSPFGAPGVQNVLESRLTPIVAPLTRNIIQAFMIDNFPTVMPHDDKATVVFHAPGAVDVHADLRFEDEDGTRWVRRYGRSPRPAE